MVDSNFSFIHNERKIDDFIAQDKQWNFAGHAKSQGNQSSAYPFLVDYIIFYV